MSALSARYLQEGLGRPKSESSGSSREMLCSALPVQTWHDSGDKRGEEPQDFLSAFSHFWNGSLCSAFSSGVEESISSAHVGLQVAALNTPPRKNFMMLWQQLLAFIFGKD